MSEQEYKDFVLEVENWDWRGLLLDLEPQDNGEGETYEYAYIGTVFGLVPSGKHYVLFARQNVSDDELETDTAFYRAMDTVAESHGCFIENGEDPCDLLLVRIVDTD